MNKYKYWICGAIIVLAMIVFTALYLSCFSGGLSANQNDWGNFGAYISGVLMPILTAINIYVFIHLTSEIEESSQRKRVEELQTQKELQLSTLRFEEVKKLNQALSDAFNSNSKAEPGVVSTLAKTMRCTSDFQYSMGTLFQLDKRREAQFTMCLVVIDVEMDQLRKNGLDSFSALPKEEIHKMALLKVELINALYAITFGKQEEWSQEVLDIIDEKTRRQ